MVKHVKKEKEKREGLRGVVGQLLKAKGMAWLSPKKWLSHPINLKGDRTTPSTLLSLSLFYFKVFLLHSFHFFFSFYMSTTMGRYLNQFNI
jgi:hypothetical protein